MMHGKAREHAEARSTVETMNQDSTRRGFASVPPILVAYEESLGPLPVATRPATRLVLSSVQKPAL